MGFQGGKQMGKWIRRFVVVVLLGIFLYSVTTIAIIMYQYKVSDELYIGAFIIFGDAELTVACARELLKLVGAPFER